MASNCCQVCRSISWEDLPSETDAGIPHHTSYATLKISAQNCSLCSLLVKAAEYVRERVDGKFRGRSFGGWAEFSSIDIPVGRKASIQSDGGQYPAGTDGTLSSFPSNNEAWKAKPAFPFLPDTEVRPWLYGGWFYTHPHKEKLQLLGVGVRLGKEADLIEGEGNGKVSIQKYGQVEKEFETVECYLHGTPLRISTIDGTSIRNIIPFRPRDLDSSSKRSITRVDEWIHTCERYHRCAARGARLPTRVLDVGNSGAQIQLKETAGELNTYACLSYCWGTQAQLRTTTANLVVHRDGIALDSLPKTIADAISICKQLEIPYLWVDALCIVQDDEADRDREIARMSEIYAKCYLTIAAVSGAGAGDGMLATRDERSAINYASGEAMSLGGYIRVNAAPVIDAPYRQYPPRILAKWPVAQLNILRQEEFISLMFYQEWLPSSSKHKPVNRQIGGFGRYFDPFAGQPITKRGWTLQERILSPRVLHYSKEQMYWECRHGLQAEDGSDFTTYKQVTIPLLVYGQRTPIFKCGQQATPGISLIEGRPLTYDFTSVHAGGRQNGGWLALVEAYSKRQLGREDDKLPALSGIANYLAAAIGDQYYAGLWRTHILEDLAWRMYPRSEYVPRQRYGGPYTPTYGPFVCQVRKPEKYRAPSWSWASLDGHVRFVPIDFDRVVAEFIDCYVEPEGMDIFGKVKSGWLQLKAPVVEVHPHNPSDPIQDKDKDLVLGTLVQLNLDHGVAKGEAFFDMSAPVFPCFAVFIDSQNCLLAKQSGDKRSSYERIGLGRFSRTAHQRKTEPFASHKPLKLLHTPWGPIKEGMHEKTIIMR